MTKSFSYEEATAAPSDSFSYEEATGEPAPKTSAVRKLADLGLGFASGAVGASKGVADAFGADNAASRVLASTDKFLQSGLSDAAVADQQEQQNILSEAKGKGVYEGVKAGVKAFGVAPAQTMATGLGSIVPTVLAGVATRGATAPASLAAMGAMGAAQGAGSVKGGIYDEILQRHIAAGASESEAAAAAERAQAYQGQNAGEIAVGGALGLGDSVTGVNRVATSMLRRGAEKVAEGHTGGAIARGLKGAAGEVPLEAAQGGQQQYAQNVAAQREGFEADPWDNVASQATFEGLASMGPGAAFGVANKAAPAAPVQTKSEAMGINPADGPLSRSAAMAVDSGLTDQVQAQQAAQQQAEDVEKGGKKPAGQSEPAAAAPLQDAAGAAPPPSDAPTDIATAAPPLSESPNSAASAAPPVQDLQVQPETAGGADGAGAPAPTVPAGPAGQFATEDDARAYIRQQRRAGGTRIEALPLPMEDGSFGLATRNSPEYTRAEFHAKQQAQRAAGILDGDVLSKAGEPFKNRLAAGHALRKAGAGHVIEPVQGGFVVRKGAIDVSMPSGPGGVAAGVGGPAVAEQRGGLADAGRAPDGSGGGVAQPAGVAAPAGQPDLVARDAGGPADAVALREASGQRQLPQPLSDDVVPSADERGNLPERVSSVQVKSNGERQIPVGNAKEPDGRSLDATRLKGPGQTPVIDGQLTGNFGAGKAALGQRFGALDVPTQARVLQAVSSVVKDSQVLRGVMQSIPVEVMDEFVASQGPSKGLLGNRAMLVRALTSDLDFNVRGRAIDALMSSPAFPIAELSAASDAAGAFQNNGATVGADQGSRHAANPTPAAAVSQPQEQTRATETPEAQPQGPRAEEAPRASPQTGQPASAPAVEAPAKGGEPAPGVAQDLVEHTTSKGKVLRGVIRKDLDLMTAKSIATGAFKKDGGFFIPEKALDALAAYDAAKAAKASEPQKGIVGRRADGVMIRQDDRGVRWYAKDGVRISETVSLRPTRDGMQIDRGELTPEFMTAEEAAAQASPAAAAAPASAPAPTPAPAKSLDEVFDKAIAAGEMPKDNPALKKLVAAFDGKEPDQPRMKVAQETLEAAIVRAARRVVAKNEGPKSTFAALQRLYESQPNLNIRTSTSIDNQAYSTPAPLAFLAGRLAGITQQTTVLEPTAGTGMLLITADPKKAHANEIDPTRQGLLLDQGFDVTRRDATEAGIAKANSVDRVITNPPFGPIKNPAGESIKVKVDGYTIGQIDHLIAARALESLKDEGRATMIIGANKATGQQSNNDLIFFNWLYGNYRVTSHFEVAGDLYMRQGAGWPVRVITVAGREKSAQTAPNPASIKRAETWGDVYERFEESLATGRGDARDGASAVRAQPGRVDDAQPVPRAPDLQAGRADQSRPAGSAQRDADVPGKSAEPVVDRGAQPDAGLGERGGAVGSDDQAPGAVEVGRPPRRAAAPKPAGDPGDSGLSTDQFQAPYKPRSARKDEGVLIPVNMASPTQEALDRLEDDVGDIDAFAAKELGYKSTKALHDAFMGLQVDSVASAIQQIKAGKGVIIADQTGIGKGRQAAAIIRWAIKNGKTPVFVTVKPSLFTDMYGDLHDIGSDDVAPFILNVSESIKGQGDAKLFANRPALHRAMIDKVASSGNLPDGRNALFMTYSQINVDNAQRRAVLALAPKAVFVLDESHNAGGDSSTGAFIRDVLDVSAGVTYLSATFAKRPDNMPVYFKTDMGEAVTDDESLMAAMAAGGLPLQTVVSNNLVKAGQMFRRERSYDGVRIESRADTQHRAEHVRLSDETTLALRAIVSADRQFHESYVKSMQKELAKEGSRALDMAGNQAQKSVDHTQFTSVVHNFVRQMLLGLKAQEAADDAIRTLKRGEKPLIAVENTMGSFLSEYAENNGLKVGDALGKFDYRTVLSRALERSRYIVIQQPNGDKVKEYIPLAKLDPLSFEAYQRAQRVIDKLQIDIPVSPIDWMRNEIQKAGYTVAEVTGRSLSVDYSGAKPKLAQLDMREQKDKVRTTRMFNSGELDAIILNVAGSTGISLHASEKFTDKRPRHMIVAQAAQDINIFMQMLGRVHRTGQVKLPSYTILNADLPAEIRPTALLSGKMKSLNANTSSNTESATSVKASDMLNKYGDDVVGQYLADNPQLADALGVSVGEDGKAEEDTARKATGRLALMPVAVQQQFYAEVEEQYQALIDYLNKTNQNDLEPRTFDFDAVEVKSQVIFEGQNHASPFGQDGIYGEYSVKAQGKMMTPAEIKAAATENLQGQTPRQHAEAIEKKLESGFIEFETGMPADQQAKARRVRSDGTDFLRQHPIGAMFRVKINDDDYNAVVTNIRSTHKAAGNPFSLSKIQVQIAVNGSLRQLTVPATKFHGIEQSRITGGYSLDSLFRQGPPNEREVAKIVTGNLLGAYGEMKGATGSIIAFTKGDGTTEQGILLPKAFNPAKDINQDMRLRSGADALAFLNKSENENIDRFGINSRDQAVRVVPSRSGGIVIRVPKSKAKGGKFFLDPALREHTGDFVSQGDRMVVIVDDKVKAEKALDVLIRKSALYVLPSMKQEAEVILGEKPADRPAFSRSGPTEGQRIAGLQQQVDAIAGNWSSMPEIILARNMQDDAIPARVRNFNQLAKSQGASGDPQGFIYGGKVYLVANQITTGQDLQKVLFHEVLGHYGLRGAFGEALNPILDQIATMRRAEVQAKAKAYGLDLSKPAERRLAAEEVLAEMAQNRPEIGFVKRAVAAVRAWLRAHVPGLKSLALSDTDILANYILPARGFVERGRAAQTQPSSAMVPAFSRLTDDEQDALDDLLAEFGEPVKSDIDAERRHAAGDRIFVMHEQGDTAREIFDVSEMTGYAPDQMVALPKGFEAPAFSRGDAANVLKALTVTDLKHRGGNALAGYRNLAMAALGRRQIVDLFAKDLPQLSEYNRLTQHMDADKNEAGAEADKLAERWGKLKDEGALASLMHDATLAQIDPSTPYVQGDDENFYDALKHGYDALSPEAKKVYGEARDSYRAHHEGVRTALRDRIERSEIRGERKAALLKQMDDEFFKAIKGVYFPLARFGQYVVVTRDSEGTAINVSRAETINEAEAMQKELRKAYPNDHVGKVLKAKEFNAGRDAVGRGFMESLYGALGKKEMDEAQRAELEDMLGQLYLSAHPDLSWAKHGLHRKGTAGFSQDARRAFAQNMFHGARYLAKVRYSDLLENELSGMQKHVDGRATVDGYDNVKAQQVVDEMVKRHDSMMNPQSNALSTALTSFGFVFHLGLSPASAMVNLTQTALVAYPIMGAKWGFTKASAALLKASQQAAANKNDITSALSVDEKRAFDEAVRAGVVDVTMAHDLAGISQGEDAKVSWKLRPVMKWASFLFHHAEKFNRQVTFVASYRLARDAGASHGTAFEQAVKATYDGHFDYSASNRPRFMQGNVAKVVLLFKQYAQNMVYTLGRQGYLAVKGATPAERTQARKALGGLLALHASAAGVLGLPMVTTLLAAASMVGGSDDEPWDAEVAMRNMLADALGAKPAEILARGLSRATPWDISGRVGLDKLILPDLQEGLEGQRLGESAMAAALGPVAGIGISALKGLQEMADGNWARGLESMAPAVARGPIKALRYGTEGAIDRTGKPIVEDVGAAGVAGQALGFSPSEVRLATEAKSAIHQADDRLKKRRAALTRHYAMAVIQGDTEAADEAKEEIAAFNQKNPDRRINPIQLAQSVRTRRKQIAESEQGVYLPKTRRDALDAGRFGLVE